MEGVGFGRPAWSELECDTHDMCHTVTQCYTMHQKVFKLVGPSNDGEGTVGAPNCLKGN
jgi:hypothetical protein